MVMPKTSLKQHFTVALTLHNWTLKLGVFRGVKGYFCVTLLVEFDVPFLNFCPQESYLNFCV
jgi:hypothetical protein